MDEVRGVTWQGFDWRHQLMVNEPIGGLVDDIAILEITGDNAGAGDYRFGQTLANRTGRTVFTLFNVPNQPLWDMREDDLISFTFAKYVETGDPTWPLLQPMRDSVLCGLDAIKKRQVVVTGASKRGWTTWLAATTGDERIVGIVPRVYDSLDLENQLTKQLDDWGDFSPKLGDYTGRALQALTKTPRGQEILDMVDPFRMLDKIKCPQLVVNGSRDDFWTVDAATLYAPALPNARFCYAMNSGHGLLVEDPWVETVGAFVDLIATGGEWPWLSMTFDLLRVSVNAPAASLFRLWQCFAADRQYSTAYWRCSDENQGGNFDLIIAKGATTAFTVESVFAACNGVRGYSLFTPIQVVQS